MGGFAPGHVTREWLRYAGPRFFEEPLHGQPGGEKCHWQTCPRVGAAPHEVEVAIAGVAVMRPQIADLHEVVAQSEGRASLQIVQALPLSRCAGYLELNMLLQVGHAHPTQPLEDGGTRSPRHLLPVLPGAPIYVADWHEHEKGILAVWRGGGVHAGRRVDVEARVYMQGMVAEYAFEATAIVT